MLVTIRKKDNKNIAAHNAVLFTTIFHHEVDADTPKSVEKKMNQYKSKKVDAITIEYDSPVTVEDVTGTHDIPQLKIKALTIDLADE